MKPEQVAGQTEIRTSLAERDVREIEDAELAMLISTNKKWTIQR